MKKAMVRVLGYSGLGFIVVGFGLEGGTSTGVVVLGLALIIIALCEVGGW